MSTVLAAVDDTTAAPTVLRVAERLGELLDSNTVALHVEGPGIERDLSALDELAAACRMPLRRVHGDAIDQVVAAIGARDVDFAVIGSRRDANGPRPAGHVALAVIKATEKPILVVPPGADVVLPRIGSRVLAPLDGVPTTATATRSILRRLASAGLEIIGLHVFDDATTPRFWDQAHHATAAWASAFAAQNAEPQTRLVLRRGSPSRLVLEVARREDCGLVALAWSRNLDPGRAHTVREVLARARIPVLLLPMPVAEGNRSRETDAPDDESKR